MECEPKGKRPAGCERSGSRPAGLGLGWAGVAGLQSSWARIGAELGGGSVLQWRRGLESDLGLPGIISAEIGCLGAEIPLWEGLSQISAEIGLGSAEICLWEGKERKREEEKARGRVRIPWENSVVYVSGRE